MSILLLFPWTGSGGSSTTDLVIQPTDFVLYLSGGAANSDPNASLGGGRSNTTIIDNTVDNLFDDVSGAEASASDVEYRCCYIYNANASSGTMYSLKVWIAANTPGFDDVAIGLGTSAIGGTEQTVANENTAPTGVTFSTANSVVNALTIGDVAAGSHKAIWIRRNVIFDTPIFADDFYTLQFRANSNHT